MRFLRLHALRFGPIRERVLELGEDAAVVFGRNESGKSSFRSALETIVYGFEPASREKHPLAAWDAGSGGDLHLEADLRLDSGEVQRVERVLLSVGRLRIAARGEEFHGARESNRQLPWVSLPRHVYRALHSLELGDLTQLEQDVQGEVDDLLLPETPAIRLRPVGDVRRALREESLRLWRPDRRGKPAAQELREQLAAARRTAHEAAEAERGLRAAREEQTRLEEELAQLRRRKRELEQARDEAPRLAAWRELARRREAAGAAIDLAPLSGRPWVDPRSLAREVEESEARRRAPELRLAQERAELAAADHERLARAAEVQVALARAGRDAADAERAGELRARAEALRDAETREIERALGAGAERREALGALDLDALRTEHAAWAVASESALRAPARADAQPARWIAALALVGVPGLLAGLVTGHALLSAVGAVAIVAALLALLLLVWRRDARAPAAPPVPESLAARLAPLRVDPSLLATPAALARLLEGIERARDAGAEAARCESDARRLDAAVADAERAARALCAALGVDGTGPPEARAARLGDALAAARERERTVQRDADAREQARQLLEATGPALAAQRAHLQAIRAVLAAAEPGVDEDGAFERVTARLRDAEFVRRREAELRADPASARLEPDARVRVDAPASGAAEVDHQLADCDAEIERRRQRIGQLEQQLAAAPPHRRAAAQDEIAALEEALAETERERDRLALLESIVARAEASFREAHQPDVLRRAGDYLRRVTDGRYVRLDYDPERRALSVTRAGRPEPLPVRHPISQGTLDQIHLCLRLGLLDHLDEDRERLPLVLDDALLRMDDVRRPEVYGLLEHVARRRQVFFLTCQRAIAREAEEALKVRRIDLSD